MRLLGNQDFCTRVYVALKDNLSEYSCRDIRRVPEKVSERSPHYKW